MSASDVKPSAREPVKTTGIRRIAPAPQAPARRGRLATWAALALTGLVLALWLIGTPNGLHGKAWAVGYAICHQIEVRTFVAGDVAMPLCARCTGTYLGVLVGFLGPALLGRGRAGRLPSRAVLAALALFSAAWAFDGLNSYVSLFPDASHLYEPHNVLRLLTGSLHGLTMSGLIYPIFNQVVWRGAGRRRRSLRHMGDLAVLVGGALFVDLLVMLREPFLLTALGLLSTLGVLALMTAINTVIVVSMTRRENQAARWRDLTVTLIVAFGLAIAEIGLIDAGRFALFGTWEGITLPLG